MLPSSNARSSTSFEQVAQFIVDTPPSHGALWWGDNLHMPDAVQAATWRAPQQRVAQLIYLDPPYNRGGEFRRYKDKLPTQVWLEHLHARLTVCRELLANTGTIWMQLDDSEAHRARVLLDEVFGSDNFIADITVECNPKGRQLDKFFAASHDRLMVYAKSIADVRLRTGTVDAVNLKDFPHEDAAGQRYRLLPLRNTNKRFNPRTSPTLHYPLFGNPDTGEVSTTPQPGTEEIMPVFGDGSPAVWRWSAGLVAERSAELRCRHVRGRLGPRTDIYQVDIAHPGRTKKLHTIWLAHEVGSTDSARRELRDLNLDSFETPKPAALMRRIIELASDPGDLVLELYGGSGALAAQAAQLGRDWIAVEANRGTVDEVFRPRLDHLTTRP